MGGGDLLYPSTYLFRKTFRATRKKTREKQFAAAAYSYLGNKREFVPCV